VFYFTAGFRRELKRRLGVLNPGGADDLRKTCGVDSVDACVDKLAVPSAVKPARRESAPPGGSPPPGAGRRR